MQLDKNSWYLLFIAWIIATVSTLGSLFFSQVLGFPPCAMCWYQRICMYPLVIILLIGLLKKDRSSIIYAYPFVIIGFLWAFYHTLLIFGFIKEELAPCSIGVPCSVKYIDWLGFIDIPTLSLFAFSVIFVLLILIQKKGI